jgi:hypothetical protein
VSSDPIDLHHNLIGGRGSSAQAASSARGERPASSADEEGPPEPVQRRRTSPRDHGSPAVVRAGCIENSRVPASQEGITSLRHAADQMDFAYRFSRYVGLYVMANVPFPTTSSYVITIFSVGLGLSFYRR